MQEIQFLEMFPEAQPAAELLSLLEEAVITRAEINMARRWVEITVRCPRYLSRRDWAEISYGVERAYDLNRLTVHPIYGKSQLSKMDAEALMALFVDRDPMCRGYLAGANWTWEENTLHLELAGGGKAEVEKCIPQVRGQLTAMFDTLVHISVTQSQELTGQALYDYLEAERQKAMEASWARRKENTKAPKAEATPQPEAIFGKPFKGPATPMEKLELDMGTVIVEGRVFQVEHKELSKSNHVVIGFDMTDNTSSIHIDRFLSAAEAKPIVEKVQVGSVVRVQGKPQFNNFINETVLRPFAIMPGTMPKRQDTAEGEKRVELHLHTAMSKMDATTSAKAAIKQAAAWGHRAIAITDHGVCTSFPEALHTVEDWKGAPKVAGTDEPIKVLYGCEAYYVNDVDDRLVVLGDGNMQLTQEYVAFDLETTGLFPDRDRIIEIGAVHMQGGKEISRFQTFVDPGRKLSQKTTDLTGITDAMLTGAPALEEVLPKFLEFVGGRMLVAHNAKFDTAFIRAACEALGLSYGLSCADTLTLAQQLMPHHGRFTLDSVAKALSLPSFNHHRAADDANICGLMYGRFLKMLADRGMTTIRQAHEELLKERSVGAILAKKPQHIILLAKNQMGLRNLYHLLSDANLQYFRKVPRIPKSALQELREGIIIGSACENNELFQAVMEGKNQAALERIAGFYDYLEIQPLSNNRFMLATLGSDDQPLARDEEQLRDFNRTVVALGQRLSKPVVATGDVHFLNPEDEIFRRILTFINGYKDFDRPNPLYFRTTDEMLEEFSYLGADKAREVVVTNTNRIADMCETVRPVPHNLFAPKIENSVEDLNDLVWGKLHRLYGENPPELMVRRVETELHDIISCHYDVIYMSAQRLVQNSLENGYLVGSRGSVGSSIVAFMSGITEVNSFPPHYRCPNPDCKYTTFDIPAGYQCGADLPDAVCPKCGAAFEKDGFNIPFETFLGFGGDKVPDIDLNFSGEYQARAHAYCTEMFGRSHVFRAGTVGTVAEKTAFGYAKKYLTEVGKTASRAEEARLASGCVGVRRTTGQHPGGLVVIPQENEIWDFCPVQHPADDPNSDQITTHFEYHSMEENLLKLDMLGHDDPTMIRMMEDMTGVDAKTIPLDDKNTMSLFTSSKVLGYENDEILGPTGAVAVPEFNTRFTRQVLLDTKPEKFDFLVRISGYTHGTDVWLGNAKDLILSGKATVDQTIGCRDDIMIYLISCGLPEKRSFKIMEAVRKGKGLPEGAEEEMRAAGVPDWYIGSCKKIKYLFPKAHAVAYVMMAFRIAWFKVYHPLAFYSAFFYRRSQKGGFDYLLMTGGLEKAMQNIKAIDADAEASDKDQDLLTTLEVVYEFYLRGFEFLPIDIYKSDAARFQLEDGKLRPPFVAVSGLGESAAEDIVRGREGRQFLSIEDFSAACPKVSKTHIQMLKDAGAFGDLPDTSQVSLF